MISEKNKKLKFDICMPVYKGSHLLRQSLDSILRQNFINYEILIGDDNPVDCIDEIEKTKKIIKSYNDPRIKYFKNERNLGYAINLQNIVRRATNEIIFLMAQDDILSKDALQKTHDAFFLDDDIGVVTRPYFWFMGDIKKPVRAVFPLDPKKNMVVSVFDGEKEFLKIFESVGQLSGLAYRGEFIEIPFNDEVFPAHIYPFAGILRKHKCVFLKDYTVAVGIMDSQTRSVSSIYDMSPTESWIRMYKNVFNEEKYRQPREWGIKHITATNYVGLVQLKNYAKKGILSKEVIILLKNRWQNFFNIKFWFFAIGALIIPKFILIKMVDNYKNKINFSQLTNIKFEY